MLEPYLKGDCGFSITSYGDALWWAVVTATTVGYGDVSPVTAESRLIAVILMLTGIGVIGVFAATVSSFFFESEQQSESAELSDWIALSTNWTNCSENDHRSRLRRSWLIHRTGPGDTTSAAGATASDGG